MTAKNPKDIFLDYFVGIVACYLETTDGIHRENILKMFDPNFAKNIDIGKVDDIIKKQWTTLLTTQYESNKAEILAYGKQFYEKMHKNMTQKQYIVLIKPNLEKIYNKYGWRNGNIDGFAQTLLLVAEYLTQTLKFFANDYAAIRERKLAYIIVTNAVLYCGQQSRYKMPTPMPKNEKAIMRDFWKKIEDAAFYLSVITIVVYSSYHIMHKK